MTATELDIATTAGILHGFAEGGVRTWRGIPFAAPPVGVNRFRSPQPVATWFGIRDATRFGPVAAQDRKGPFEGAAARTPRSEDCLTLNVIAPAETSNHLPVMVYIHGGAYGVGSPSDLPFRGVNFVRRGAVHVTLNYRLNAFGYLDFSEYGFDNNLGLRDQVAALQWVHDNIAAFGGDPGNVTVYGESSGGNAVTTLFATPAARGLFARAIAQSPPSNAVYRPDVTRGWARQFMSILGARPGGEADALRTSSTADLVTAARLLFARVPDEYPGDQAFSPVIDGDYLPEHPVDAFRDGLAHPLPLIIGTNDREGSVFFGRRRILATTRDRIEGLLRNTSTAGAELMRTTYRLPGRSGSLDFGGDFAFWFPTYQIAQYHSAAAPTWVYRLDYAPPLLKAARIDATHGADLLTVFGRTTSTVGSLTTLFGGRGALAEVSRRMQDYWFQFAKDGSVDASWPQYDTVRRANLIFDARDRVEPDSRADRRRAWDAFSHLH
ncbi:MAG: carboxylesterase [Glaciihabitans sp.]|nr:carboxylesterase [Glaciihabitans sp.]MDQ1572344.1 para-nitrobenzyl esterase [Actinomycetota bacterium]